MAGGGTIGNQNARRGTMFRDQLTKIIAQENTTLVEKKRSLYRAASKLLSCAVDGEAWAIRELANRLDGKAIQGVELSNPDGTGMNLFDMGMLRGMDPEEVAKLRELLKKAGASAATQDSDNDGDGD